VSFNKNSDFFPMLMLSNSCYKIIPIYKYQSWYLSQLGTISELNILGKMPLLVLKGKTLAVGKPKTSQNCLTLRVFMYKFNDSIIQ